MRRSFLLLLAACLALAITMTWSRNHSSAADQKEKKVLRHLVLYKFKPETTPAQLQQVIDAFSGLPKKIDAIIDFEHGPNVSPEGKSDGLTYAFLVTFRDEQGRDDYLVHPAHQDYVKVVQDKREKVIVFDYWAQQR
jgi:stress responsive alpha/beta barrel protein